MSELLSDLDLDESSEPRKQSVPKTHRIEQIILLMADAVWAVVGLFLWLPQIVRVVITSAVRLVHAALTRQPVDSIRGPIRQVSRFYVDGFLSPGRERTPGSYGSRQLHLGRFLTEALWVVAVWLGILWLVSKEMFASVWRSLVQAAGWAWSWISDLAVTLFGLLPESVSAFTSLGTAGSLALAFVLIVFLAAGFVLGRRSR